MKKSFILWSLLSILLGTSAMAQETLSPIYFIYDASGSMWGQIKGKTKMAIATEVLGETVQKLPEAQKLALVAYGHREKGNCEDVEFLVNTQDGNKGKVVGALAGITPLGKTPLAYSALQVIDKLRQSKEKATIILITDGIESCGGDLCAVIKAAKEEGIEFRLHIVGFGLKADETEQLRCAASAGDGQYYDAADAEGLSDVMNEATTTTVDDPVSNFSVYAIKNGEPIDAYVKAYKAGTTENIAVARTYQDTGFMFLPPGKYDFEFKPLENSKVLPITVKGIEKKEAEMGHQTISFDGGTLKVQALNNGEGWDAMFYFYPDGEKKSVASKRTYGEVREVELNPGVYDVEIKALVLKGSAIEQRIEDVVVEGNVTKDLVQEFTSGVLSVGAQSGTTLVDATVNIYDTESKKNAAAGRTYTSESNNPRAFQLTPGTYEVVVKALGDFKGKTSKFTVTVKAGKTIEKIEKF